MIYYLCNGKAPCRELGGIIFTECSYVNIDGQCRHTTMEEFAKNPPVENPRDNPKFKAETVYADDKPFITDYWEVE